MEGWVRTDMIFVPGIEKKNRSDQRTIRCGSGKRSGDARTVSSLKVAVIVATVLQLLDSIGGPEPWSHPELDTFAGGPRNRDIRG